MKDKRFTSVHHKRDFLPKMIWITSWRLQAIEAASLSTALFSFHRNLKTAKIWVSLIFKNLPRKKEPILNYLSRNITWLYEFGWSLMGETHVPYVENFQPFLPNEKTTKVKTINSHSCIS